MKKRYFKNTGQALITLLFFTLIGMTIAIATIILSLSNSIASSKVQSGELSFAQAEAGAENGYLRLLRDPSYTGETMTINNATVTTIVTGTTTKTLTSTAVSGSFTRKVQLQIQYTGGQYVVQSWKEIF